VNKIPVAAVYAAMLIGAPAGAQQTPAATGTATSNPLDVGTLDGVIGPRGGIPLLEGARMVGAIGCSGGTGSQDEAACKAGVAALQK
jgi:uncharacterized protein GlcG (DUF336 family)